MDTPVCAKIAQAADEQLPRPQKNMGIFIWIHLQLPRSRWSTLNLLILLSTLLPVIYCFSSWSSSISTFDF